MTTATIETSEAPATYESEGTARPVPITHLVPNPWNRGPADSAELLKLAESIKAKGYLNPILVRPLPSDPAKWQIVAGEQRYHAGLLAERTYIPAIAREDMTDQEVMEIMKIENERRTNPSPMQQAQLIRKYREQGYKTENLAAVLGESATIIRRREKLLDLSAAWQKQLTAKESPFALWTPAHLELIARYHPKVQDDLLDVLRYDDPGEMTPAKLAEALIERTKALHLAPWDLADATLVAKVGSCHACPKRTGAQADLFGEVNGKASLQDSCPDEGCWKKKEDAHISKKLAELKKEHGDAVLISTRSSWGCKSSDGSLGSDQYSVLQKQREGAKPGVYKDGEKKGHWTWINPGGKGGSKAASSKSSGAGKAEPKKSPLKERMAAKDKQRDALAIDKFIAYIENEADGADFTPQAQGVLTQYALAHGLSLSTALDDDDICKRVRDFAKKPWTAEELWEVCSEEMTKQLSSCKFSLRAGEPTAEDSVVKLIAWLLDVDFAEFRAEALAELPDPKSWAGEAAAERMAPKGKSKAKKAKAEKPSRNDDMAEDLEDLAADPDMDEED